MPNEDKDKEQVLTAEEQEKAAHEKRVNEDPGDEPLPVKDEKEKPEAEKEEPEKKEAKEEGQFDAEILSIAADLGIDEAKARSYSSVADLERVLLELSSRDEPKAEKKAEKKPEEKAPEKIYIEAGDDLDEALVKQLNAALDGISGRYDEKAAALEEKITSLTGTIQANQAAQFVRVFDDMLVKHGGAYVEDLGEGGTLELSGKHRANRDRILDEMGHLVTSHQLRNKPIPSDDQLVQRAIKEILGEKEKDNGEVEKRKGQYLRRGSSRSPTPPSKQIRARLELREKLAALGGDGEE